VIRYHYLNILKENLQNECTNINNINKTTVSIKIKELEKLVKETKNPQLRKNFENDLTSYKAIRKIFEDAEKK
tara:strand:+ start:9186 stop:9404 length:219 start_codon:yes stop_codon:yes gene_type:complete